MKTALVFLILLSFVVCENFQQKAQIQTILQINQTAMIDYTRGLILALGKDNAEEQIIQNAECIRQLNLQAPIVFSTMKQLNILKTKKFVQQLKQLFHALIRINIPCLKAQEKNTNFVLSLVVQFNQDDIAKRSKQNWKNLLLLLANHADFIEQSKYLEAGESLGKGLKILLFSE